VIPAKFIVIAVSTAVAAIAANVPLSRRKVLL
jgi:hypothetical protein